MVSTLTGAGAIPDHVETTLPVVPDVGGAVVGVVRAVTGAWGVPDHVDGLAEAARAVSDELVDRASVWSILDLSVERDELDVYVRLSADVDAGTEPTLTGRTRAMVSLATGSHHVVLEGTRLLIVLQATWR